MALAKCAKGSTFPVYLLPFRLLVQVYTVPRSHVAGSPQVVLEVSRKGLCPLPAGVGNLRSACHSYEMGEMGSYPE